MRAHPKIAIISANQLLGLGLKSILERLTPMVEIDIFDSQEEMIETQSGEYMHYFISYLTFCNNRSFYLEIKRRTIILVQNNTLPETTQGIPTLNINQKEEPLVKEIIKLRSSSHIESHSIKHYTNNNPPKNTLTEREIEVISFIAQGMINKEIADKMNISITTVISHRKNIVIKLGIKSVAALTIYAINNGMVDPDNILM